MQPDAERVVSKISWRLIPLLFLCYIIAYIDRINVGFAGLQLQKAFGVDSSRYYEIYGWGRDCSSWATSCSKCPAT